MSFANGKYDQATEENLVHSGSQFVPKGIAMHYTVTDTLRNAINALNGRRLSYTFLIDRDGTVVQTRKPDIHAAHAGRSHWKAQSGLQNTSSLNRQSIAISFVSRGYFGHLVNGFAYDTDAHGNIVNDEYPASEVKRAPSLYDPGWQPIWHRYTDAQITAAERLVNSLAREYPSIEEIYGHDDISISGKSDTGPLFPMQRFREQFNLEGGLGFRTTIQSPDGIAELRRGPSSRHTSLGQLHNGDTVFVRAFAYTYRNSSALAVDRPKRRYLTGWASVDTDGGNTHAGFVYAGLFANTPLINQLANRL
ncbi:N-acetylmuramoyl-L-alanine amidase [Yoonia sediminilitoris]|uniref:N-acetylmuramoyl-L-alanine amidase n=1 Tax=Yoonia sediminilitoris TaxID=1286148 RepID=A0A2T6KAB9_9RHOB|nr:N-acetylmuramoyl-L-alanine amidase [Yoonia sediminilitoris]PUB11773.1 N-acetylmuramoyl-L-alanine amidase [Yoonia sediminilitoris]RCW91850.1 N-acetylmuramoyl-L-alanine amidase [Yoonia sediminilitoris]